MMSKRWIPCEGNFVLNLKSIARVGDLPAGATVDLPGRGSTYVTDTGPSDGPTLMLLHGLTCTGLLNWYPVFDMLAARGRVVVYDQRWHGRGIRSPRFSLEDCADDTAAVADALGIDRYVTVGYSMGSLVSQLAWQRHRDRVAGMVLCAATTSFRRAPRERFVLDTWHRVASATRLTGGALPARESLPTGDPKWALQQFLQTSPGAVTRATGEIGKFDSSRWIHTVDVPTSVVVTARDKAIPARRQRWLARQITGATSYEIDGGHASCVMRADEFSSGLKPATASVLSRLRP